MGAVWFLGNLDDPWVAELADALPVGTRRLACAGDLPDPWPDELSALATTADAPAPVVVVVVHRALLTATDAERLARLRSGRTPAPRVVLCVGPHARHGDLERWSARGIIDAIVPEATARDTIARHLAAGPPEAEALARRPAGADPRPGLAVVSANAELRRTLADACAALGYAAEPAADWSEAPAAGPALWDVPVLEPDWPRALARRARLGPLVVLLGFADRSLVTRARTHGAAACLELPCDLFDLGHVLDRVTGPGPWPRVEPAHAVPPAPAASTPRRRVAPKVAGPGPVT
jgi:hypothetical protein